MAATNFFLFKEKHFTNHVTVTFNGPILGRGGGGFVVETE